MGFMSKMESFFNGKGLEANKTTGSKADMEKRFQDSVDNPQEKFDGSMEEAPVKINQERVDQIQRAAEQSITGEKKLSDLENRNMEQTPKTSEPEMKARIAKDTEEREAILDQIKEMPTETNEEESEMNKAA